MPSLPYVFLRVFHIFLSSRYETKHAWSSMTKSDVFQSLKLLNEWVNTQNRKQMPNSIKRHTRKMPSAPEAAGALTTLHHSNTTGKKPLEMIMSQTDVSTRDWVELDHNCIKGTSEYNSVMFSWLFDVIPQSHRVWWVQQQLVVVYNNS